MNTYCIHAAVKLKSSTYMYMKYKPKDNQHCVKMLKDKGIYTRILTPCSNFPKVIIQSFDFSGVNNTDSYATSSYDSNHN